MIFSASMRRLTSSLLGLSSRQFFLLMLVFGSYLIPPGFLLSDHKIIGFECLFVVFRQNRGIIEKKLLAISWAIKHFRPYLCGRKFEIYTDHWPLTWLLNVKDPNSRLVRWRLLLEEYEYEIEYRAGRKRQVADALCRIQPQLWYDTPSQHPYDMFMRSCE